MGSKVMNAKLHCQLMEGYSYSMDEMMRLGPTKCITGIGFFSKLPKRIQKCCGLKECQYHRILPDRMVSSNGKIDDDDDDDTKNECKNRATTSQLLSEEIVIAQYSDVSDSERSQEHNQHCCIHKNNIKVSFNDLVRYKNRKTQPTFCAHENAVINPKYTSNKENKENVVESKIVENAVLTTKITNENSYNNINSGTIPDETPFSRIFNKVKEKGLIPKTNITEENKFQNMINPEFYGYDTCRIHKKVLTGGNVDVNQLNYSALTDNFHSALSMFPSALRRKLAAIAETTSTTSMCNDLDSNTEYKITSHNGIPDVIQPNQTYNNKNMGATTTDIYPFPSNIYKGKTVVPPGTLEKILYSKQKFEQPDINITCTCNTDSNCSTSQTQQIDDVIDMSQLEKMQLNINPHRNQNHGSTSSQHITSRIITNINKENINPNEGYNNEFRNLMKHALNNDRKQTTNNNTTTTLHTHSITQENTC